MKLREIFDTAKTVANLNDWLYLPADLDWTLDTEGVFLNWEDEEVGDGDVPLVAKEKNLVETLDGTTLRDVVQWADRLAGVPDADARLDVFRYYYRFDAFPERLGAPDPPPADEIFARLDREFYDSLGVEREGSLCRREGCSRGAVQFSSFCRVHQFENVKKKPCPFEH